MHYFTKIINILYFLNVLDDMAITEELIILTLALNLLQQGNILLHMQAV